MEKEQIQRILKEYGVEEWENYREIDTSREDYRLNVLIDKKYVLRINDRRAINEERLGYIDRLAGRYNALGILAPTLYKNKQGEYITPFGEKVCYLSEYLDYPCLEYGGEDEGIVKEIHQSLGRLAAAYTGVDLAPVNSMWSIFDLSPFDNGMDERAENALTLIDALKKAGEEELAEAVKNFVARTREQLFAVYKTLPRCVYQGDLNCSNILVENGHFKGLIDFNMSGTEVNINCFLSETNRSFDEEDLKQYSADDIYKSMLVWQNEQLEEIFRFYTLNEAERGAFEWYRNLVLISQYPNVCSFIFGLKNEAYKVKTLELIRLIIAR